ncbi:MAG TPA: sulfatase [bacterium]|nr:sulfatase [bacterium]
MRLKAWLFSLLFIVAAMAPAAAGAGKLPNIIILSVDALRADHTSYYGYPRRTTPNIDQVAARGTVFMDATSLIPLTCPSFSTVFTSLPTWENGVNRNGIPLGPEFETLPAMLRARGYTTAAFVGCSPLYHTRSGFKPGFSYYSDGGLGLLLELDAKILTRRAQKLLEKGLPEPFFLWLHYPDPHQPHWPISGHSFRKAPPAGPRRNRVEDYYDSEAAYADHWLGVLLDDLRQRGLLDNTLLIITADHGENVGGEKKFIGHGRKLYQTILNVPLIVAGPGIPQGRKISDPVELLDLSPTILAYLGLEPGARMEGRELISAIKQASPLQPVPFHFESYGLMVLDLPGLKSLGQKSPPVVIGMRAGDYKIIYTFKKDSWELYNLKNDPQEERNLFDPADPGFRELAGQLVEFYEKRGRPGPQIPEP